MEVSEIPSPPIVPYHRPDADDPLVFVTFDAVCDAEGFGERSREEPVWGYDRMYQIVNCSYCEKAFTGRRNAMDDGWLDWNYHIETEHVGTKWATVTVFGEPDYGIHENACGKHFRRHVDLDRVNLLDFTRTDDGLRGSYKARFQLGRWKGSVSNRDLSRYFAEAIEFGAFDMVGVNWHHRVPAAPASESERIERAKARIESDGPADVPLALAIAD